MTNYAFWLGAEGENEVLDFPSIMLPPEVFELMARSASVLSEMQRYDCPSPQSRVTMPSWEEMSGNVRRERRDAWMK